MSKELLSGTTNARSKGLADLLEDEAYYKEKLKHVRKQIREQVSDLLNFGVREDGGGEERNP